MKKFSPLKTIVGGIVLIVILCLLIQIFSNIIKIKNEKMIHQLFRNDVYPFSFGAKDCRAFENFVKPSLNSKDTFFNILSFKNVYFATLRSKNIVLKKLATDAELEKFDRSLCNLAGFTEDDICNLQDRITYKKIMDTVPEIVFHKYHPNFFQGLSDMTRCGSHRIEESIKSFYYSSWQDEYEKDKEMMMFTILSINPEPLMLRVFKPVEGWPFPHYLGACGRVVAIENSGKTLNSFYHSDWFHRAELAIQLLEIAGFLTENNRNYALYLLDVSYDNFGVLEGKVKVIDLENILVVDKKKFEEEKPPQWDELHQSQHMSCNGKDMCISFSFDTLCNRFKSDHNYYALCQNILSIGTSKRYPDGLLHDIPDYIHEKSEIETWLKECQTPSKHGGRFEAAEKLIKLLRTALAAQGQNFV